MIYRETINRTYEKIQFTHTYLMTRKENQLKTIHILKTKTTRNKEKYAQANNGYELKYSRIQQKGADKDSKREHQDKIITKWSRRVIHNLERLTM